jgi:hypothetical protein
MADSGWGFPCSLSTSGLSYVKGFTSGVPKGRLVILDMEAEEAELWVWSYSLYNTSFIWCSMNNFGGNNGCGGRGLPAPPPKLCLPLTCQCPPLPPSTLACLAGCTATWRW